MKVRFAPSPTGYLHVGGLRTALYNYLYARKTGAKLVLRIEDTDQSRKVEGTVEKLLATFNQVGLSFDEGPEQGGDCGPYYQSQRLTIYQEHVQRLLENGDAYPCFCTAERLNELRQIKQAQKESTKYDRHCLHIPRDEALKRMQTEPHVIRLRIPDDDEVIFYDKIREKVIFHTNEIDDQVLIKSDGFPTYHLANVVDDHLMGITHVIRGEEWLASTPKHILLYRFFDWKPPAFSHLPLLLNPDKSKLSKRQGDVAVEDYLKKGYLSEALLNFVALLGWHPGNDQEIFSLSQLIKVFSIKRIQKSGAVFDVEKLKWMNGMYLRDLDNKIIAENAKPFFAAKNINIDDQSKYLKVIDDARRRISTLSEIIDYSEMFYNEPELSAEDKKMTDNSDARKLFTYWVEYLQNRDAIGADELKELLKNTSRDLGIKGKQLYFPIRLALYGSPHGPDIPTLFDILGMETVINRFKRFID